ncbi:threonyl-tRNA synthetase [Candidatus Vecturithrix granuli]|uniref:Threonine--tRNA ligase n=1 Tax=Vecturithrix granuli TaxID=1499967 RepID=A0A081C089_VECG1|nr:threonyl-tRNA synthetase [Candidatus Vecturithrix granuli]
MNGKIRSVDIMTARHSLSHVLAAAVKKVCPECKLGIGPAIDEGFYYDFLLPEGFAFSPDVLQQIANEMKTIIKQGYAFERRDIRISEARERFADEPFKQELIAKLEAAGETTVGTYRSGEFTDLCSGPHVSTTRDLQSVAWKLDRVSGAYWQGSEKNPMLQRIYALVFATKDELKDYIARREDAIKRDHRKLNEDLELFTFSELIGKGLPILLPNGATLRRVLERFIVDEELRRGYQHVYTPPMGRRKLYEVSGHWEHYQDAMYPPMEVSDDELVLRPMTCPHHFMIYQDKPRSYRDLPMRIGEISPQFRKEKSGELTGLIRVMMFTLADAHIFCTLAQLGDEFRAVVELVEYAMQRLGITDVISYRASLRDDAKDKYVDNPQMWQQGEATLIRILDEMGLNYVKSPGDAAFYGPKLDVQMRNTLGKEETVFTVQIDFCLPERFELAYIDDHGQKQTPVVIHRASIGCLERTIAFLTEYYAGAFPLWLAPVQAKILTITNNQIPYAKELEQELLQAGIRVQNDIRNETIGKKIREGRLQRMPYLLIVGEKEMETRTVAIRNRDSGNQQSVPFGQCIERIAAEQRSYSLTLQAEKDE